MTAAAGKKPQRTSISFKTSMQTSPEMAIRRLTHAADKILAKNILILLFGVATGKMSGDRGRQQPRAVT